MLRNKLVRSDGSIIDSSVIISCEFTEEVNSGENLTVGDVTSSEINVEIRSTDMVEQGEVLTYYIIEDDVETRIGVFNVEKPTVASRTSIKFSAFDNVVKSEKLFSDWLRDNQNLFPMTLGELVTHACEYCGMTLVTNVFPQSGIEINAFYADGITCRQILAWASAIAGRFVRANRDGEIEFAWYENATNLIIAPSLASDVNSLSVTDDGDGNVDVVSKMATVTDDGEGNVSVELPSVRTFYNNGVVMLAAEVTVPYKQGSLSYETYTTDVIERVQIKQAEDDVGVIYPAAATGNCFVIRENMILATCSTEVITTVAKNLYEQLCTISYVPVKATLPRTIVMRAGDIISVRDQRGTEITTYIMKMSVTTSGTNIESTGTKSYDTNAVVAFEKYTNLTGKMLRVEKSIDGLEVVASDLDGRVSTLKQTTTGLTTRVSTAERNVSTLSQTAARLTTRVETAEGDISTLEQTAGGLTTRVGRAEGSVSTLEQTAARLTTRVETAEGDISTLEQTAQGLTTRVETTEGNHSELRQDVNEISSRVETTEGNYSLLKQDVDKIESRVQGAEGNYSNLRQDVEGFTMTFQSINDDIEALDKDLQGKYNERVSYIRFADGNIILGKEGSDIMLIQKNDRISFVRNVQGLPEVAWFADDILHVTEGQFTVQLGIGKFGFTPGENGNLSFRKVLT